MQLFYTAPTPQTPKAPLEESKSVVKKLTLVERQALYKDMSYLVPGLFTSHKPTRSTTKRQGRNKSGHRTNGTEGLYFPSPEDASKLNNVFNIFQTANLGAISSGIASVTGALNFTFNQLSHVAALTAIFDQYRLAMVEVVFLPTVTINAPTQDAPLFYTVVDLDDSAATTTAAMREYPGVQETSCMKQHKHTFTPHVAIAAYSGTFTSFANESAPWIDVASPSVQHYGVKYGFAAEPSASTFHYDIRVRYHFQFRNVR